MREVKKIYVPIPRSQLKNFKLHNSRHIILKYIRTVIFTINTNRKNKYENDFNNFIGNSRYPCAYNGNKCKQKFQNLTLLTFEKGNLEFDIFSIPTICGCCCGDSR